MPSSVRRKSHFLRAANCLPRDCGKPSKTKPPKRLAYIVPFVSQQKQQKRSRNGNKTYTHESHTSNRNSKKDKPVVTVSTPCAPTHPTGVHNAPRPKDGCEDIRPRRTPVRTPQSPPPMPDKRQQYPVTLPRVNVIRHRKKNKSGVEGQNSATSLLKPWCQPRPSSGSPSWASPSLPAQPSLRQPSSRPAWIEEPWSWSHVPTWSCPGLWRACPRQQGPGVQVSSAAAHAISLMAITYRGGSGLARTAGVGLGLGGGGSLLRRSLDSSSLLGRSSLLGGSGLLSGSRLLLSSLLWMS